MRFGLGENLGLGIRVGETRGMTPGFAKLAYAVSKENYITESQI